MSVLWPREPSGRLYRNTTHRGALEIVVAASLGLVLPKKVTTVTHSERQATKVFYTVPGFRLNRMENVASVSSYNKAPKLCTAVTVLITIKTHS